MRVVLYLLATCVFALGCSEVHQKPVNDSYALAKEIEEIGRTRDKSRMEFVVSNFWHESPNVRAAVCNALEKMPDKRLEDDLIELVLSEQVWGVAINASSALSRLDSTKLPDRLLAGETFPAYLRERIASSIGRSPNATSMKALNVFSRDSDQGVREAAMWRLYASLDAGSVELLESMFKAEEGEFKTSIGRLVEKKKVRAARE